MPVTGNGPFADHKAHQLPVGAFLLRELLFYIRTRVNTEFEQRMMRPTFADHGIDEAMVERVRLRYLPHQGPVGARFTRPMHVRLLRMSC
jgi:hypothetical protein